MATGFENYYFFYRTVAGQLSDATNPNLIAKVKGFCIPKHRIGSVSEFTSNINFNIETTKENKDLLQEFEHNQPE